MKFIFYYLIIINIAAGIVWCLDKYYAKTSHRRIPEKVLFLWAILGGSLGAIIAMQSVRHKTKHLRFVIGLPLILIGQIMVLYLCFRYI